MESTNVKFPQYVVLIDGAFLRETVGIVRQVMGDRLGRALPLLDLPEWLTCLLLDAGVRGEGHEVQVLLVEEDKLQAVWTDCSPALPAEVDGKACRTALGELAFSVVSSEELATTQHLYCDLAALVLNDPAVELLLLVPAAGEDRLREALVQLQKDMGREAGSIEQRARWFCMAPPHGALPCPWLPLAYSFMHTLGIGEDELRSNDGNE